MEAVNPCFRKMETVLCGVGLNPDGFREAWVAVIPEPATLSLLIAGFMALRKKRRR